MKNKEINKPTYLELRDIILKFKHKTYLLTPWSRVPLEKLTSKL